MREERQKEQKNAREKMKIEQDAVVLMIGLKKKYRFDTDFDLNGRSTRLGYGHGRRIERQKREGERKNEELDLRDDSLDYYYR
jgi:hypothetical protein